MMQLSTSLRARSPNSDYPREGQNSSADSSGKAAISETGGAESGAVGDENGFLSIPDDPRLLAVINAWPTLSEDTSEEITRLVGLASDDVRVTTAAPHGK